MDGLLKYVCAQGRQIISNTNYIVSNKIKYSHSYPCDVKLNIVLKITAVLLTVLMIVPASVMATDAGTTDQSFSVTDGTGREFTFDGPTDKIVTGGKGASLTVYELGCLDKIVAVDQYSMPDKADDERLDNLNAVSLGSLYYDTNNDYIAGELDRLVKEGVMSYNDAIILTGYTNCLNIRNILESTGFTHVLVWTSIEDYGTLVDFVETMSMVVTGSLNTELVNEMEAMQTAIDQGLEGVTEKREAIYVRYTTDSGEFTIGNTGSIAVSLIESAGGINIGRNEGSDSTRYGDTGLMLQILGEHPDAVILLDVTWKNSGYSVADFRQEYLGGDTSRTVLQLESVWNNYGPDAKDGLWAVAQAMYPSIFGGQDPGDGDPTGDGNILLYVGAAAAVLIIIAAVYFLLLRRS